MDHTTKFIYPNPILKANWFQKLFFSWLSPLFVIGYKRTLKVNDLHNVIKDDTSAYLASQLQIQWNKQKQMKKPSLTKALFQVVKWQCIKCTLIEAFEITLRIMLPLEVAYLMHYFDVIAGLSGPDTLPLTEMQAYLAAGSIGLTAFIIAIIHHPFFYGMQLAGMRIRIALCSVIYSKSLKLSHKGLTETTTGQIVNLMSNDVNRFDAGTIFFPFVILAPLECSVVLYIIYTYVGLASISGFSLLFLLVPFQTATGRFFSKFRMKIAHETDKRVRLMGEILSGMKVIKMYCWENYFGNIIKIIRAREIKHIFHAAYLKASIMAPYFSAAKMMVFVTMAQFSWQGGQLTPRIVFICIGLYNVLRLDINLFIPYAIQIGCECMVSLDRIQEFLLLDEQGSDHRFVEMDKDDEDAIKIKDLSTPWEAKPDEVPPLKNLNLNIKKGELIAVIGPVGSGKSSLLKAILGEIPLTNDNQLKIASTCSTISYTGQEAWIFSSTMRQNITFGSEMDSNFYEETINAVALDRDINGMENLDLSLVGERGIQLSGGQKARVGLARAVYSNSDIILMDDPLSAVDALVGRHLFDKCICGILKDKTRILVTHQLQYIKEADRVVIFDQGSIQAIGVYSSLVKEHIDISKFLQTSQESLLITQSIEKVQPVVILDPVMEYHDEYSLSFDRKSNAPMSIPGGRRFSTLSNGPSPELKSRGRRFSTLSNGPHDKLLVGRKSYAPEDKSIDIPPNKNNNAKDESKSTLTKNNIKADDKAEVKEKYQEDNAEGEIGVMVYKEYLKLGTGCMGILLWAVMDLTMQSLYVFADWWLTRWSDSIQDFAKLDRNFNSSFNSTYMDFKNYSLYRPIPPANIDLTYNMIVYTIITVSLFVSGMLNIMILFHIFVSCSKNLHDIVFQTVLRSPCKFFDINPAGRILNRFSKDLGQIDEILPLNTYDLITCVLTILTVLLVAGTVNPWIFIPMVPMIAIFWYLRMYYLATSRDVKRLEGSTRSPVFTHINASVNGLTIIRAFRKQQILVDEFDKHQDLHSSSWYIFLVSSRWIAVRLDLMCAVFVSLVAFSSVMAGKRLSSGMVGLSITYATALMGLFQWAVRQSAEVENMMTSVERLMEYKDIKPEAPLSLPNDPKEDKWPKDGDMISKDICMKYDVDGPNVLNKICFHIKPCEKIGIVGRTGAGKSSLISMLFRLSEPSEGAITIDGLDTRYMGLHTLRSKLSIIPQDPVLFLGTLRENLDPFERYKDDALWDVLEEVQLKPTILALTSGLSCMVIEGGQNYSVGQRQLICLARALLSNNKIIVIDEATANVDHRTDALIQDTIRNKFKNCTILTIAHRLHTIMDSDRIMVLDKGNIVEFDNAHTLLSKRQGHLFDLVEKTGEKESTRLFKMSAMAFKMKEKSQ